MTVSGRWYLLMTVAIGVVAITTGNNVIYVIESLLLSALILSGILSERVIISVDAEIRRGSAIADSPSSTGDEIVVRNRRRRYIFCVEIGEWIDGNYVPLTWIPQLKPLETLSVKSKRIYKTRGIHRWNAIAIATSYPLRICKKDSI